ncbi:MAG: endonuclease/exonuclease/phosphatase family protein [Kiritimatiellae bacterium]|nr:endonuclease/exonuclease/phosphatase family protein [Kiritimatiellia bacterium]
MSGTAYILEKMDHKPSNFFSFNIRLRGLLTAAGIVASAGTLLGFAGRFSWFLDLFSHFRVQYLLGLIVLTIVLFIGHHRKTAYAFLIFAGINLVTILPLYFSGANMPEEASPALRAMLINVNTRFGDPNRVRAAVLAADPDILVLEEISSLWMKNLEWLTHSHPHSLAKPRGDNFGIGLYSKLPIVEAKVVSIGDAEVPSILATISTPHANLRVIATHPLPPGGRDYSRWRNEQLERLPDYVRSHLPVLLLGDLNVTPWNYHFRRLLARSGLRDSAKGYGVQPTWPSNIPLLRIPIDHCLHSEDVIIVDRKVGGNVSSDHYPLIVDFVIRTAKEGLDAEKDAGKGGRSGNGHTDSHH